MDYNAVAAVERLTGDAFFTPTGQTGQIRLGNIQMHKLDYSPKRKQHFRNSRGKQVLDRDDAYGIEPKFTIEGDEFTTALLPLLFLATSANADFAQVSGTAVSVTATVTPGLTYDLGALNINTLAMTAPASKTENTDYIVDYGKGKIYIPLGSTIAAGATMTVTFNKPVVAMDSLTAFSQLNRLGTLQVHEEDEYSLVPKTIYDFPCSLSTDNAGDTKPEDYKKFTLVATLTGTMAVRKRKT